jgi:ATP-binding cassette subfamily F protein uup
VKGLSGGQKKRIAIAKALIQPADLLLLDEPTNHLDHETVEWLEGYLSQYKGSLLLITHDRYFLNRVVNRIFELDKGKLYEYDGNYETYVEKKAEREAVAETNERKRQNILRRELEWLRRGAKARTTKQKARIQRVDVLANDKFEGDQGALDIAIGSQRLGKKVIELDHVSKAYGSTPLIQSFSYLVTPGDRLGIIGANGSGKSTLLHIFAGQIKPDSGSMEVGETVKIGYYTQEYEEMDINLRVIEYVKEEAEVIPTVDGNLITAEQMLERFLFSRDAQWTYIRKLSGGERRRLYLLRTLMSQPNVLLLDEPTNDLDTKTLTILEDYLHHFPGVVITVSHDRYFLDKVVDHLLAFKGNGEIKKFQGNYSDYLESESTEIVQKTDKSIKPATADQKGQQRVKLSYKDQREWETIEDKIEELEGKIALLKTEIIEAASDSQKVQKFYEEQLKVEEQLEKTMERWEELSLLVEQIKDNK